MNILIFANKKNKKALQQCLDWSHSTGIRFQMTFTTNEKEITRILYNFEGKLIVIGNDKAAKFLSSKNKKFVRVNNDWYSGVKHESW